MDQVSRPLLIALGATVVLVALWMVALKPKPVAVENTPLAPTTAIPKAKQAAAAAAAASAASQAAQNATGGTQPAPAPAKAADPAPAKATTEPAKSGPQAPAKESSKPKTSAANAAVARDIKRGKVVVLLFWNAKSADDIATRATVRSLNRRGGKVAVHVAPISTVGEFESITDDVTVAQSPTIVVIDRKGRARTIVGLAEGKELSQVVGDALAGR